MECQREFNHKSWRTHLRSFYPFTVDLILAMFQYALPSCSNSPASCEKRFWNERQRPQDYIKGRGGLARALTSLTWDLCKTSFQSNYLKSGIWVLSYLGQSIIFFFIMERVKKTLHYLAHLEWTEKKQNRCIFCEPGELKNPLFEV